jgi:hypothetical protein
MMTLNVPYKEYLKAKWWMIVSAVAVSMVLAVGYAFVSWDLYFTFLAADFTMSVLILRLFCCRVRLTKTD